MQKLMLIKLPQLWLYLVALLLFSVALAPSKLFASDSLSYSGRLVNANGSPVTVPVNLKVDLAYTDNTASSLCTQSFTSVALTNGVFHLKLDLVCSPDPFNVVLENIPTGESLAIRITDETHAKIYSYQALHSMPFSKLSETSKKLVSMGATDGQVLTWDSGQWKPLAPAAVASGSIGTNELADGSVTNVKVATGIGRAKLATGTPNYVLINDGSGFISETAQIGVDQGGTGASTAAAARANLGIVIGTTAGMFMGADAVPTCAANEKLSMTVVIADYLWDCIPDGDATKLPLAGGQMSGAIDMFTNRIIDVGTPLNPGDAANKAYVDTEIAAVNASQWITNGSNIHFDTGNVGLGTATPAQKLDVVGNVALSGKAMLKSDTANYVELKAPAALASTLSLTLPGTAGVNGYALTTDGNGILSWSAVATTSTNLGGDLSGPISNAQIVAGIIVDADISGTAAIAQSKISGLAASLSGKEDSITAGTAAQYWRGDKSWSDLEVDIRGTDLLGLTTTAGSVTAADTVLSSIGKLVGNINAVSSAQSNYVLKAGDTMSGALAMGTNQITGLGAPTTDSDAATKKYVDDGLGAINSSQWTTAGADIYYNTGNVGIGTLAPASKLHVSGTITSDDGVAVGRIDGRNGLEFYSTTSGGGLLAKFKQGSGNATPNYMTFTNINPGFKPLLSVDGGDTNISMDIRPKGTGSVTLFGNVGVGVAAPVEKLDVAGSIALTGNLRLKSDTVNYVELKAPAALASTLIFNLPGTYGISGQALISNGAGILSWSDVATTASAVGGDLSGTIANAQLVAGAIVDADISATAAIAQSKIANLATDLAAKEPAITAGVMTEYWRGDKSWQILNTTAVPEGANLYFTEARALGTTLTGYGVGTAVPLAVSDTLLQSLGKLEAQIIANDAAFDSTGQWSKSGSNIYFSSGNVGIGTNNPLTLLQLGSIDTGAGDNGLTITGGGPGTPEGGQISLHTAADYDTTVEEWVLESYTDSFRIFNTTGEKLIISATGDVGIGTFPPASKLDVAGGIRATELCDENGTNCKDLSLGWGTSAAASMVSSWPDAIVCNDGTDLSILIHDTKESGTNLVYYGKASGSHRMRFDATTGAYFDSTAFTGNAICINKSVSTLISEGRTFGLLGGGVDWTVSGTNIYRNGGFVGIGTATPSAPLEVRSSALGTSSGAQTEMARFTNSNTNNNILRIFQQRFTNGTSWDTAETRIQQRTDSTDQTYISFSPDGSGGMAFGTGSAATEKVRISSNGNMGLGTTTPRQRMDIAGDGRVIFGPNSTWGANLIVGGNGWSGPDATVAATNGNLHLESRAGAYSTYINWYGATAGLRVGNGTGGGYGPVQASAFTVSSDIRLKENIESLPDAVSKISKIRGVTYKYKDERYDQDQQIGVIAQEVQKVYPEAVLVDEDGMLSVNYSSLVAPLIEAVKEQQEDLVKNREMLSIMNGSIKDHGRRIASLEIEKESLKVQVKELKAENLELKARLERIEKLLLK
jgi:hypothetical protein